MFGWLKLPLDYSVGSPRSVPHFPSLSKHSEVDLNSRMFAQDIQAAFMNMVNSQDAENRKGWISVDCEDDELKRVESLFSGRRNNWNDSNITLSKFIEDIAGDLAWRGEANFEIVMYRDVDAAQSFRLHRVPSRRLYSFFNYYVQMIPEADQEVWNRRYTIIPKDTLWRVFMPAKLGGRAGHLRLLRSLSNYNSLGPEFWRNNLGRGDPNTQFDFSEYVRSLDMYLARITNEWGWTRRDYSQEYRTEFEWAYRTITFRRAQAVLREHIVLQTNRLLAKLGVKAQVNLCESVSSQKLELVRDQMVKGEIPMNEALEITSKVNTLSV